MRFDADECPIYGDIGSLYVPLRQPKQGPAWLWLAAQLMGLPESLPGAFQVAEAKPDLANRVLSLAAIQHVVLAELLRSALRLSLGVGPRAAEMHDLGAVHTTDSGKAGYPLLAAPPLRSVSPLDRPPPVGETATDADRAAIDPSSRQRVELSADCRHGGLVDEGQTVVDATHGDQGIALLLQGEGLDRRNGESLADPLCKPCLTERFLLTASQAARQIGQRECLSSMRRAFFRGLLEQSLCPAEPSVSDGGFQALEMIKAEFQSHRGCLALVVLLQVSGVRAFPRLDCRVGISGEPSGLR